MGGGIERDDYIMLLHLDGNLIDDGKNNYEITGGTGYSIGKFGRGATGYIYFPDHIYDFLLNDYTVDLWWYSDGAHSLDFCLGLGSNFGMLYSALRIQLSDRNFNLYVEYNSGNSHGDKKDFENVLTSNTWHHIAVTKKDDTVKGYVDGGLVGTIVSDMSKLGSDRIHGEIHCSPSSCYDEIRIIDKAVWDGNFVPPDAPYK